MTSEISNLKSTEQQVALAWWWVKVLLSVAVIVYAVGSAWVGVSAPDGLRTVAGLALTVFGVATTVSHWVLLRRQVANPSQPERLVTRGGMFVVVRHPMYLGDLLVASGLTVLAGTTGAALLLIAFMLVLARLCFAEDRAMAGRFGATHSVWCEDTYRLLPGVF